MEILKRLAISRDPLILVRARDSRVGRAGARPYRPPAGRATLAERARATCRHERGAQRTPLPAGRRPTPRASPDGYFSGRSVFHPRASAASAAKIPPAFTLIELLVVIAIVAVLASLLLPSLSRAKESGRTAVCRGNLRQFGLALRMYVQDTSTYPIEVGPLLGVSKRQYFEPGVDRDAYDYPGLRYVWWNQLAPYVKDRWWEYRWTNSSGWEIYGYKDTGRGVWSCPSLAARQSPWPHKVNGYAYNANGLTTIWDPWKYPPRLGLGGDLRALFTRPSVAFAEPVPIRETEVRSPANLLAIGDSDAFLGFSHTYLGVVGKEVLEPTSAAGWGAVGLETSTPSSGPPALWQETVKQRHAGHWQNAFCDGHVEDLTPGQLFDVRQDLVRRRWNNDDAPHPELVLKLNPTID